MSPQARDQSKKGPLKEAAGYPNYPHSQTSTYYPLQIHHIKHNGNKFQMSKETHQLTKSKPLLLKLSPMSILFQATTQTKKDTHRGALTFQITFQGKTMERGTRNS